MVVVCAVAVGPTEGSDVITRIGVLELAGRGMLAAGPMAVATTGGVRARPRRGVDDDSTIGVPTVVCSAGVARVVSHAATSSNMARNTGTRYGLLGIGVSILC